MNEGENMARMSFEGQHESLPFILEVIREEEEDLSYNEVSPQEKVKNLRNSQEKLTRFERK